jgi:hypothetical protein
MPENTTASEVTANENVAATTDPKQAKAEAKAQAKAIEDAKAETARLAKDNEDLRASLAKLSSAVEALTAAKAVEAKEPEPAAVAVAAPSAYRPVTLRNNKPAPFYYDDVNGANTADKGVALKAAVKLTEQQWKRRTPAQWGVLVANEVVTLEGVPEADQVAFEEARDAEDRRLANHSAYDQVERQVMAGKFTI